MKGFVFSFPLFIVKGRFKSFVENDFKASVFNEEDKAVKASTPSIFTSLVCNAPLPVRLAKVCIIVSPKDVLNLKFIEYVPPNFSNIGANFCTDSTDLNVSANDTFDKARSKLTFGVLGLDVSYVPLTLQEPPKALAPTLLRVSTPFLTVILPTIFVMFIFPYTIWLRTAFNTKSIFLGIIMSSVVDDAVSSVPAVSLLIKSFAFR